MKLYETLSKINFLKKSYTKKFLFVAFLGIHIPLIGLITVLVFSKSQFSPLLIIAFTLMLTLIGTIITLLVIHRLIKPIDVASKALINYRSNKIIPNLPMHYKDEAGRLLANIQISIMANENFLKQKQDLIYLLTHDIKNFAFRPKALADLILEEEDADSRKEYAELIILSSNQQIEFLESFISLLKFEEEIENAQVLKRKVSLHAVAKSIQQQLDLGLKEKNIVLEIVSKIDEVFLTIDEVLYSSILYNLIYNALKFSNSGSVIKVTIRPENGFLLTEVKDSGIGFDISKKEILFNKFSVMGRMGTENENSTGIGLYLCNQIVQKFGGSIEAFSEGKDKGAVFKFKFELL